MTQLALRFDAKAAQRSKDQAIARVDANTSDEWRTAATEAVMHVAAKYPETAFSSDDVWMELAARKVNAPHIKDALGAIMRRLQRAGVIEVIGWKASERPESHGQPKRLWRRV